MYICDDVGQLKHKLETTKFKNTCTAFRLLCISEQNEIITSYFFSEFIEIYTEEGNLRSTIKLPAHHMVQSLAFHHVVFKILVLTKELAGPCFLLRYSELGELETTTLFLPDDNSTEFHPTITSHPSGTVAVVTTKNITFI